MSRNEHAWVTTGPLFFNDPKKGQVFAIPAGEPCTVFESVEQAQRRGLLPDETALWMAKTNIKRGYRLVLLRGMLRGVSDDDVSRPDRLPPLI